MDILVVRGLLKPALLDDLSLPEWDLLIRQGRRANLLARLAFVIEVGGLWNKVPEVAQKHLSSAKKMADEQDRRMRWELECLQIELGRLNIPIILLKGAAYFATRFPNSYGRIFSDIDILVTKQQIVMVESELLIHGWEGGHHNAYDQRYYRQWMHEIPPLRHSRRGSTIDVHHSILPETAAIKFNSSLMHDRACSIPGQVMFHVLQPVDMILHSATHLFHEGELGNGLRDLFDLHELLKDFGEDEAFWDQLVSRAEEVGLTRPLWYALRFTTDLLRSPVPSDVMLRANVGMPSWPVRIVMDFCYRRALKPMHSSCDVTGTSFARYLLYIRSHWIRMPFPLLVFHLGRKYFLGYFSARKLPRQENV